MNASEMTFGIEIECCIPAAAVADNEIRVGEYHRGEQVPCLPSGWVATYDGSVSANPGTVAMEIVSPVLRGPEGLRQAAAAIRKLHDLGAKVNNSCGFHVHIGFSRRDLKSLRRLVNISSYYEPALFAATGTVAREHGYYCRSIKSDYTRLNLSAINADQRVHDRNFRYHSLNIRNLVTGTKPTVEFRVFGGTMNAGKAVAFIRLCMALVEKALTMKVGTEWDAPVKNPAAKGAESVARFIKYAGWTSATSKRRFGEVTGEGLPTMADSAAMLRAQAEKYDHSYAERMEQAYIR